MPVWKHLHSFSLAPTLKRPLCPVFPLQRLRLASQPPSNHLPSLDLVPHFHLLSRLQCPVSGYVTYLKHLLYYSRAFNHRRPHHHRRRRCRCRHPFQAHLESCLQIATFTRFNNTIHAHLSFAPTLRAGAIHLILSSSVYTILPHCPPERCLDPLRR